jgi:hypothetical protein
MARQDALYRLFVLESRRASPHAKGRPTARTAPHRRWRGGPTCIMFRGVGRDETHRTRDRALRQRHTTETTARVQWAQVDLQQQQQHSHDSREGLTDSQRWHPITPLDDARLTPPIWCSSVVVMGPVTKPTIVNPAEAPSAATSTTHRLPRLGRDRETVVSPHPPGARGWLGWAFTD